jgi:hypothetical protein
VESAEEGGDNLMKQAIGKYALVRSITEKEAIFITQELLRAEDHKLWAKGAKLRAEGGKLRAEGSKLWAEGSKLWAEIAIQQRGFIPDDRAINFIAADRSDGVYCFVWARKEIWFYDGENCPDPETVEVVWKAPEKEER